MFPFSNSEAHVEAIGIRRRLSEDFYQQPRYSEKPGGDVTTTTTIKVATPADVIPNKKPQRTGWRRYLGIIFTFCASLNFSFGVLFAKLLQSYNYHGNCASFWRYIGVTVPALPLMMYYEFGHHFYREGGHAASGGPISTSASTVSIVSKESLDSHTKKAHISTFSTIWPLTDPEKRETALYALLRGIFAAVSVVLRYYALEYLPIGDTSVISYSTPVLVTILAHFMLGERAGLISFVVAFTTLVGVIIVAKPPILTGAESFTSESLLGTGLAVASLICASMQIILTRKVRTVHFALLTISVGIIGLAISGALMLYFQDFQYPTGVTDGFYVAGLTGCSFLGQMSIILALKFEQAGPVALIRTSDVVIGFVLQYAFINVVPEWTSVAGGGIVVAGVLVTGARKWVTELPVDDPKRKRWRLLLI